MRRAEGSWASSASSDAPGAQAERASRSDAEEMRSLGFVDPRGEVFIGDLSGGDEETTEVTTKEPTPSDWDHASPPQ